MAAKKNDAHYHHADHVLISLACIIFIAVLVGYLLGRQSNPQNPAGPYPTPTPIGTSAGCTMEARSCPDGTFVGRTGPNCEFAPCPGS